jgi:hypothetical protein
MSVSNTNAVTRMTLEYIIAGVAIEWLDPHLALEELVPRLHLIS